MDTEKDRLRDRSKIKKNGKTQIVRSGKNRKRQIQKLRETDKRDQGKQLTLRDRQIGDTEKRFRDQGIQKKILIEINGHIKDREIITENDRQIDQGTWKKMER